MLRKILPPVAFAAGAFFLLSNDPAAADDIPGTPGEDDIDGTPGDDTIDGGAGSDEIDGDNVGCGEGDTECAGDDVINGGDETDTDPGEFDGDGDVIEGDNNECENADDCAGNDTIGGGGGDDFIQGDGNFCDNTASCGGNDVIDGGSGDDEIAGDGNFCGVSDGGPVDCAGDDTINGGDGNDVLIGDDNDCIFDNSTAATCAGDDTLHGDAGNDVLVGDQAPFDDCEADTSATLDADDACAGDDILNGGDGDDILVGDSVRNDIAEGEDEDLYCGFTGEPSFVGCVGDDILDGGAGNDILLGDDLSFEVLEELFFGIGAEGMCAAFGAFGPAQDRATAAALDDPTDFELAVPGGNDTLNGGEGDDQLCAGNGDDTANGGAGNDLVLGDVAFDIDALEDFFGDDWEDFLDFLAGLTDDELRELLIDMYFTDVLDLGGGNDTVSGDAGTDVVLGNGGHDVVCGDAADPLVAGGGGSDVPCPVVEGLFDASDGTETINLATGIRELDDEFLEVDGNGAANPWEIFIIKEPTQGKLTLNGTTVTYVANPGATGQDSFEYVIRRKTVACPGNIEVTLFEEQRTLDLCDDDVRAQAVVIVDGVEYVQSGSKTITFILPAPVVPPATPELFVAAQQGQALPVTGGGDLGLALAGLGLVALGAAVTAESKRRSNQLGALA